LLDIQPVTATVTAMFLAHRYSMVAGSVLSLSEDQSFCHRRYAALNPVHKAAQATIAVVMMQHTVRSQEHYPSVL